MIQKNIRYGLIIESNTWELELFYIENKNDLAEFIRLHYQGKTSETNKIPFKKWFIYDVDNSGDYVYDNFILLCDYKQEILNTVIEGSILYKQLSELV